MEMMRIKTIIILAILFLSCEVEKKSNGKNPSVDLSDGVQLNLEKISEFKIENTQHLTLDRIRDVVVLNQEEKRLAWVNEDKNEVFITDINGKYICKFGSQGRGPKEFLEITSVGFGSENNIFVYDAKLDLFKKFNDQCKFFEIYEGVLERGIWLLSRKLTMYDNRFYLGIEEQDKSNASNFWKSKTIGAFTNEMELKNSFGVFDSLLIDGNYLYSYPMVTLDRKTGLIYTTHRTLPIVQVFNPENELREGRFGFYSSSFLVASETPSLSDPIRVRREKNLEQSFVEESFVSDEHFFLQYTQLTEDLLVYGDPTLRKAYLNIFEKEKPHAFLGEISLEFVPLTITSKGKIFLLEDNNPENFRVGVYELEKTSNL